MSYKVNDYLSISVFIEGKELPLDSGNMLNVLHIAANSQMTLPTLHLRFVDMLRVVPSMGLQDGSPIIIALHGVSKSTRSFRVQDWTRVPSGDGFSYAINAYWDSPVYWAGTTCAGIKDTSYGALSQIAKTCGLKFWDKNSKTSDSMLWLPGNKSYGMFARTIARGGFVNEKSHMVLAVDSIGTMRYVNVEANPKPSVSVGYLSTGEKNFVLITDFQPSTRAGTNNLMGGYMHTRYGQSVLGSETANESQIALNVPPTIQPLINPAVRKLIKRGVVSYGSVDFGNVHPKYERAKYQNSRFNLLNGVVGEFLFALPTAFEPTDNFNYVSPATSENKQYNGEFTVTAKIIFITGSNYNEKVIAVRNGITK